MSYKSAHPIRVFRWNIAQYFEKRWWRRYLSNKKPNDYIAWKKGYWVEFLRKLNLEIPEGQSVLDIGTGPAGIQMVLSKYHVHAIDPLFNDYLLLEHFKPEMYPWTHFEASGIESFNAPFLFQNIFCLNVINHVHDIQLAHEKIYDSLQDNGMLVLSIDCHRYRLFNWLLKLIPLDILHPHQYSLRGYETLLGNAGLKIEKRVIIKKGWIFDYWVLIGRKTKV